MRIKINDKIYRLKEIESGVDSLMELVEVRKFKVGDKVKIKDGISSETHRHVYPHFTGLMDEFIGKELTVKESSSIEWVVFYEDDYGHQFAEDWLEPYTEELKKRRLGYILG